MSGYIYLASPYSDPSEDVRERRYKAALQAVNYLTDEGEIVYSPIVHFHEVAETYGLPRHYKFWQEANRVMIQSAERLMVLTLQGWENSKGVRGEILYAQSLGKSVQLLRPRDL